MLCQQHWWLVLSFFSHYFRFWGFPSKSPQLTFPFWEVLGVDFQFPFSKALRCYFSDPPFGLLHLLSFSLNGQILFYQAERSTTTFFHGPSPRVPQGTGHFFMSCWFTSLLPIFCIIGWLMGHICSRSLCSLACSHELSQSQLSPVAYPKDPRLLGISKYLGSTFSLDSLVIFSLKGRAEVLFFFVL